MSSSRDSFSLAKRCARLLDEKKLEKITIFRVADSIQITDYFVIATGLNPRHLRSASDFLVKEFRSEGVARSGLEGYRDGGWILLDFDDVIVHLFLEDQRKHYDLELLWGDSPKIDWPPGSSESDLSEDGLSEPDPLERGLSESPTSDPPILAERPADSVQAAGDG